MAKKDCFLKIKGKEFFYTISTNTGDWNGFSSYSGFIEADTPKEALSKVWESHGLPKVTYADRSVNIYDGASYRKMMPKFPSVLASYSKAGDGSRSSFCSNPDCPYC